MLAVIVVIVLTMFVVAAVVDLHDRRSGHRARRAGDISADLRTNRKTVRAQRSIRYVRPPDRR